MLIYRDGYISWVSNGVESWTIQGAAMGPNSQAGVGQRMVAEEPMYLIVNLGLSENFGAVDVSPLVPFFPLARWKVENRNFKMAGRNCG